MNVHKYLIMLTLTVLCSCGAKLSIKRFKSGGVNSAKALSSNSSFETVINNSSLSGIEFSNSDLVMQQVPRTSIDLADFADTSNLVAHWKFSESSAMNSDTLTDSINSIAGTLIADDTGVEKLTNNSILNNALNLDGSGDYVSVPNDPNINIAGTNITVSAWIYPNSGSYSQDRGIVCLGPTDWTINPFILALDDNSALNFRIYNGSSYVIAGGGAKIENKWTHVVGTYDGSNVRLYQDGKLITEVAQTGSIASDAVSNLHIGKRCGTDNRYFDGKIDEVSIFSRTLSLTEIQEIHDKQGTWYQTNTEVNMVSAIIESSGSFDKFVPNQKSPYLKPIPTSGNESSEFTGSTIDSTSLVSYWPFEHTNIQDTSIVTDKISLNNNNGTYNDSVSVNKIQTGIIGNAIEFDGVDDYIQVPNDASLEITSNITLSAWVKLTGNAQANDSRIISKGNSTTNDDYALRISDKNGVSCRIRNAGGVTVTLDSGGKLTLGKWHHVGCTYDGSRIRVYLNGKEVGNVSQTGLIGTSGQDLFLGSHGATPTGRRLEGLLDEVNIWSRVLSEDDMMALYKRGAVKVKYQVKFCNSSDCSDSIFMGPDSTASTFFSDIDNYTHYSPEFDLSIFPTSKKYFQYKVIYETLDESLTPHMDNITLQ